MSTIKTKYISFDVDCHAVALMVVDDDDLLTDDYAKYVNMDGGMIEITGTDLKIRYLDSAGVERKLKETHGE